jgi:hypothetical protein
MCKFLLIYLLIANPIFGQSKYPPDVIVYGGTAGGIIAAIAAAKEGNTVLIIEPGHHLGGMVTGGLSNTDYGDRAVIGGLAVEFYRKVAKVYNKDLYFLRGPEPTVGENIFKDWLRELNVKVIYGERIQSTEKDGREIKSIRTVSGKKFSAKVYIDASYEGDLFARAGVSYAIGRESVSKYGESWAGRQPLTRPDGHNFHLPVSPFKNTTSKELLPLINTKHLVPVGEADGGVQEYGFRLIMTNNPANRVEITRPDDYDSNMYELIRRYLKVRNPKTLAETGVINPHISLPNQKADVNSSGPISTDLCDGSNWAYPDADYPLRDKIWNRHLQYTKGLLYFIQNDPSVPEKIRSEAKQWGLCKDEFTDTKHYPHQLYIREARRMVGEYVLTQHDLEKDTLKYDAVCMGAYNMDIRDIQRNYESISRFPELRPEVFNEGYLSIPVHPYQVPYRSLVPKYDECSNLIVPVCISASAMAFSSFRMEPQFMSAGHAAGVAASIAIENNIPVQRVDINTLQKKLIGEGQIVSLEENPNGFFQQGNTVIVDNDMRRFVEKHGNWQQSQNPNVARYEISYLTNSNAELAQVVYRPYLPETGQYKMYGWWAKDLKAASNVPIKIETMKKVQTVTVNQRQNGDGWVLIGTYQFEAGRKTTITIANMNTDGIVEADAFKFELLK